MNSQIQSSYRSTSAVSIVTYEGKLSEKSLLVPTNLFTPAFFHHLGLHKFESAPILHSLPLK